MRVSYLVIAFASVLLLTDCGQARKVQSLYKNAPKGYYGESRVLKPPGMEQKIVEPKPIQEEALEEPIVMKPSPKPILAKAPPPPPPEPMFTLPPEPVAAPPAPPPPPTPKLALPAATSPELTWTQVDYYDARNPTLPAKTRVQPPSEPRVLAIPMTYEDVTVFPVDGDMKPYATLQYDFNKPVEGGGGCPPPEGNQVTARPSASAEMAQQIFFAYGSAKVNAPAREGLKKLATDVAGRDAVRLSVVGHASKRVDHVEDPIARKMINFKMAQKRADAVTSVLHQEGVKPDWVLAVSKGDEVPNPNPGMKSQEDADRRVEVYVDERPSNLSAAW